MIRLVFFLFFPPWGAAGRRDPALGFSLPNSSLCSWREVEHPARLRLPRGLLFVWYLHPAWLWDYRRSAEPAAQVLGTISMLLQGDDKLTGLLPPRAEGIEAEIPPCAGSGAAHQPNSSLGQSCTLWTVCNFLVTGGFHCLYSQIICRPLNLSQYSRDLCCHFLVKRDVQQWTILQWLNKPSHCSCLPPLNTSERHPKTSAAPSGWSTGCFCTK